MWNLLLCVLLLFPTRVHSRGFIRLCDLSTQPVIHLQRDPVTGEYSVIPVEEGGRRDSSNLRGLVVVDDSVVMDDAIQASHSRLLHNNDDDDDDVVSVRKCTCSTDVVYCPIDKQYCGIPRHSRTNQNRGCINVDKQTRFVRSIWMYLVVTFGLLAALLVGTRWGRTTLVSLPGNCVCGYTTMRANFLFTRHADQANALIRRNLERRRRILERRYRRITGEALPVATPVLTDNEEDGDEPTADLPAKRPTCLALKTRIYQKDEHDVGEDDEFDDEDACTICFVPLQDGDRVGALDCQHDFHSDCLKQWLKRRNCCPLCQTTNAATPRYDDDMTSNAVEHTQETGSTNSSSEHAEEHTSSAVDINASTRRSSNEPGQVSSTEDLSTSAGSTSCDGPPTSSTAHVDGQPS